MARRPSLTELRVLSAMLQKPTGHHYGLALIRETGVKGGSLYPILRRLEDRHWVVGEWEDIDEADQGRRRRRYYKLTPNGVAFAAEAIVQAREALDAPVGHGGVVPA